MGRCRARSRHENCRGFPRDLGNRPLALRDGSVRERILPRVPLRSTRGYLPSSLRDGLRPDIRVGHGRGTRPAATARIVQTHVRKAASFGALREMLQAGCLRYVMGGMGKSSSRVEYSAARQEITRWRHGRLPLARGCPRYKPRVNKLTHATHVAAVVGHGRGTRPAATARIVQTHVRKAASFGALREMLQAGCLRYVMGGMGKSSSRVEYSAARQEIARWRYGRLPLARGCPRYKPRVNKLTHATHVAAVVGHGRGTRPAATARIVQTHVRKAASFGALREMLQAGCLRYVMGGMGKSSSRVEYSAARQEITRWRHGRLPLARGCPRYKPRVNKLTHATHVSAVVGHGRGTRPAATARIVQTHVRKAASFGALREMLQAGCLRYVMGGMGKSSSRVEYSAARQEITRWRHGRLQLARGCPRYKPRVNKLTHATHVSRRTSPPGRQLWLARGVSRGIESSTLQEIPVVANVLSV